MNVQAAPSPYVPVGGNHTTLGSPPVLGPQRMGTTGGLPALGGISTTQNPLAEQLQSMGRGEDKVLVHMTPEEVNSLQGLAMASGGSLTINPHTGLPEAGWLGRLLPTILGVAGAAFGLPTWAVGLGVGAGKAAISGDLSKGLMAGLEAFGGAGLGQAAGLGGSVSKNALGMLGGQGGASGATSALAHGASNAAMPAAMNAAPSVAAATPAAHSVGNTAIKAATNAVPKSPGFLTKFADATSLGQKGMLGKALPIAAGASVLGAVSDATAPKMPGLPKEQKSNYVPMRAGRRDVRFQTYEQMRDSGGAEFPYFTPSNPDPVPYAEGGEVRPSQMDFDSLVAMYQTQNPGPITASMYPTPTPTATSAPTAPPVGIRPSNVGEVMYDFRRNTPATSIGGLGALSGLSGFGSPTAPFTALQQPSIKSSKAPKRTARALSRDISSPRMELYANGGTVDMRNGSFVVDARTVSELGNGSSNAGIELLSRMGGRPVHGPGDGVSDSVKASIDGAKEARVARDEVIFSPEAVRRIGGGNAAKGTQKLYAMMEKAHRARKKAERGQDTKLRKGLV